MKAAEKKKIPEPVGNGNSIVPTAPTNWPLTTPNEL
jgi:hypothetical protein